ncbi:hypothetical protein LJR074_001966 [Acidovorax sp. LjRoot74]|uniref:hypothetical protein n=1 Tax=Acidovorax sp. LjRoot74 TaxID=3342337 RepID=UPI003ECCFFA0
MKLQTAIKPRRDGTVTVQGLNGKTYVFQPDEFGELNADVEHEATVAHLLSLDSFLPADEADFDRALLTMKSAQGGAAAGDDEGNDENDSPNPDAPPLEARTPPAASGKATKAAAKATAAAAAAAKP